MKPEFLFLIPTHPSHRDIRVRCLNAIKDQAPNKVIRTVIDTNGRGQVYWLNSFLETEKLTKTSIASWESVYVNFHGADDFLIGGVLSEVSKQIEKFEYPRWLYFGHYQNGVYVPPRPFNYELLRRKNYIAGGSVFVRLDMYLGRRFRDIAFKLGADWEMWLRLGHEWPPIVIDLGVYNETIGTSTLRNQKKTLWAKIEHRFKRKIIQWKLAVGGL